MLGFEPHKSIWASAFRRIFRIFRNLRGVQPLSGRKITFFTTLKTFLSILETFSGFAKGIFIKNMIFWMPFVAEILPRLRLTEKIRFLTNFGGFTDFQKIDFWRNISFAGYFLPRGIRDFCLKTPYFRVHVSLGENVLPRGIWITRGGWNSPFI